MGKVLLEYTGARFPWALTMPWLKQVLSWNDITGRTIEVDRQDAERLVETSGRDFHIVSLVIDLKRRDMPILPIGGAPVGGIVPPEIKIVIKNDKVKTEKADKKMKVKKALPFRCPHCDWGTKHKPSLKRHITVKHKDV